MYFSPFDESIVPDLLGIGSLIALVLIVVFGS
jgi:hypothetical protein